jgi:hypothetical protein
MLPGLPVHVLRVPSLTWMADLALDVESAVGKGNGRPGVVVVAPRAALRGRSSQTFLDDTEPVLSDEAVITGAYRRRARRP